MAKNSKKPIEDPIVKELDALKRLFTLFLLKTGTPQGEIAMALQVDQSVVSRMFSARNVKPYDKA